MEFDYTLEPGRELNIKKFEDTNIKPVVSVIMPFYNDRDHIRQSATAILNQTFPLFEFLIIDDGSKDEESVKVLDEVSKWDSRIKVFHKENEGVSAARDYGASVADQCTKYFLFIDSDDLIDPTYMECAYWTLETNKTASWTYSDSLGFDADQYLWNKWFDSKFMKKRNDLVEVSFIRKEAFFEVNGYELREKALKISKKTIKEKALDIFKTRYSKLLELFMLDTDGNIITEDDLTSLTGNVLTNKIQ
jgi:glycosyltransferase involved in cell wall biosynthesis